MMGKARRWLKGLFGNKKKKISNPCLRERGNKKASSFGDSLRRLSSRGSNPTNTPQNISPAEAAWLRMMPTLDGDDKDQSSQSIEVAHAAVKVVEATVQLVRVASSRGTVLHCSREALAAITIQTFFRGYLARKALRALKALVKVQALVRGLLVRRQTYAIFDRMKSLIRAQENVLAQKARGANLNIHQFNCPPQFLPRKSPEKFNDSRKNFRVAGRNKRISAPFEPYLSNYDQCINDFEVASEKTISRSRRIKKCLNGFNADEAYSHATSSPTPHRNPGRGSLPGGRSFREFDQLGMMRDENKYSTAQISPVFTDSCGSNAPSNQAKSDCGDVYFRNENENYPNYMVNTQSFNAKMRSQSVPKQRGDEFSVSRKRLSLHDLIMESRSCQNNGARMQMSCSQAQGNINFKNNVMVKTAKPSNFDN